jgi:hypothetical protein
LPYYCPAMKKLWMGLALAGALGCQSKGSEATASSGAPSASGAPGAVATGGGAVTVAADGSCGTKFEYLVPPQKYGDSDLVRAIVIDGDQVFYRNMSEAFRVPLAGGTPVSLGKAPGLSLSGTAVLWTSGDKLFTQSPGEPIFMSSAKAGGAWSSFIDLTAAKRGGDRDAATRILQGLGKSGSAKASRAAFDGQTFYFAEVTRGKGRHAPASSVVKSVALAGGEARTLFETPGEVAEVTLAGERLAFLLTSSPTPEQIKQNEAARKEKKYVFGVKGESHLTSVPLAGGEAKKLLRIGPFMSGLGLGGVVLGADGTRVYVSGFRDEDITKPGTFRVDAASGSVEKLDERVIGGKAFVSGGSLVLVGGGSVEPQKTQQGLLVLTAPREGKSLALAACITDKSTLHVSAVSGKIALQALFDGGTGLASIAKIPLP